MPLGSDNCLLPVLEEEFVYNGTSWNTHPTSPGLHLTKVAIEGKTSGLYVGDFMPHGNR